MSVSKSKERVEKSSNRLERTLIVQAMSAGYAAGNFARIYLNDRQITLLPNENKHDRGLHMVVINPASGKVVLAQVFDTYKSSDMFEELFVKSKRMLELSFGYIVAAACKDDCVRNLSEDAKQWFSDMGSKEIKNLGFR